MSLLFYDMYCTLYFVQRRSWPRYYILIWVNCIMKHVPVSVQFLQIYMEEESSVCLHHFVHREFPWFWFRSSGSSAMRLVGALFVSSVHPSWEIMTLSDKRWEQYKSKPEHISWSDPSRSLLALWTFKQINCEAATTADRNKADEPSELVFIRRRRRLPPSHMPTITNTQPQAVR